MILKKFNIDNINILISKTSEEMGRMAAKDVAVYVRELLKRKPTVNMIFAAAPSQLEFLAGLSLEKDIDWSRVNVFHMDEYIGLSEREPQSFAGFIRRYVVDKLGAKSFFFLRGDAEDIQAESERYTKLLTEYKPDIVCCGIGENGHIAFNDPWEADFWDDKRVKVVNLDEKCRRQQVNDKCFECLEDVPKQALTLTIPMLMSAEAVFCIVPGKLKAQAVSDTMLKAISVDYPASILRVHKNAKLYCDEKSGKFLLDENEEKACVESEGA